MNVKELDPMPSVRWVLVAAVPFFAVVIGCWYVLKYWFAQSRNYSEERRAGIFEGLISDLSEKRPELFDRNGPKDFIVTADRWSQWRWRCIMYWAKKDKERMEKANRRGGNNPDEPIGLWSLAKRKLIIKWAPQIQLVGQKGKKAAASNPEEQNSEDESKFDVELAGGGGGDFIAKGLQPPTAVAMAQAAHAGPQFKGWQRQIESADSKSVENKSAGGGYGGDGDVGADPSSKRPSMPPGPVISGMMVEEGSDESELKQIIVSDNGNITQEGSDTGCTEDAGREAL